MYISIYILFFFLKLIGLFFTRAFKHLEVVRGSLQFSELLKSTMKSFSQDLKA